MDGVSARSAARVWTMLRNSNDEVQAIVDPREAAETAGLRYVSDEQPGIRRRKAGKGFSYTGLDGKRVREKTTLERIRSLAIPPAWTEVWICPKSNGHIQATGRDLSGEMRN